MVAARVSREEIYMNVAREFARRSTCLRKNVGAVLVRDNHILGTGYNGAPHNQIDCQTVGQCQIVDGHCVRTVHAEVNAVLSAAYNGVSTKGAILFTTARPCFRCRNFLINAGVTTIWYDENYEDDFNTTWIKGLNIRSIHD